jgi:hypothetical protein
MSPFNARSLRIAGIALACAVAGAVVFGALAYFTGVWMGQSYVRQGPSDPGDAPVYVAFGLGMFSAFAGSLIGTVAGLALALRRENKRDRESL